MKGGIDGRCEGVRWYHGSKNYLLDGYARADAVAAAADEVGLTEQEKIEVDAYLLGGYFGKEIKNEGGIMNQITEVDQKALTVIEQARSVIITDSPSYTRAGELWKAITDMKKQVDESFKPIILKAHQAHKEALAQRAKIFDPLDKAGRSVKTGMESYDREQERIRQEEERRLREIARQEEEERQLAEALEAERNGDKEEMEVILEAPIYVPPVIVPKTTPKLQGGPVYRTIWQFRITDAQKIPRAYLMPDEVKIGGVVRALKEATNVPGVEAYSTRV